MLLYWFERHLEKKVESDQTRGGYTQIAKEYIQYVRATYRYDLRSLLDDNAIEGFLQKKYHSKNVSNNTLQETRRKLERFQDYISTLSIAERILAFILILPERPTVRAFALFLTVLVFLVNLASSLLTIFPTPLPTKEQPAAVPQMVVTQIDPTSHPTPTVVGIGFSSHPLTASNAQSLSLVGTWQLLEYVKQGFVFSPQNDTIFVLDTCREYSRTITGICNAGQITLRDIAAGQELSKFSTNVGHYIEIALSPTGTLLAVSDEEKVVLWSVETGQILQRLVGHTVGISDIAFSADSNQILASSDSLMGDGGLLLWNISGQLLRRFDTAIMHGNVTGIFSVGFAPHDSIAVTSDMDRAAVWDVVTGEVLRSVTPTVSEGEDVGGAGFVKHVEFSPDGNTFLACVESVVFLIDTHTGKQLQRYSGHSDMVLDATFSKDGKIIASSSRDETVILWNVATGQQLHRLFDFEDIVTGVEFNFGGTLLATQEYNGRLQFWQVQS